MSSREHAALLEAVRAKVARIDPVMVSAADEQDQSLIRRALGQTPRERLRACTRATRMLFRYRRAPTQAG